MQLGRTVRFWWRAMALSATVMLVLLYWNYNNTSQREFVARGSGEPQPPTAAHEVVGVLLFIAVLVTIYTLTVAIVATVSSRTPRVAHPGAAQDRAQALQTLAQTRATGLLTPEEFEREVAKLDQRA